MSFTFIADTIGTAKRDKIGANVPLSSNSYSNFPRVKRNMRIVILFGKVDVSSASV